MLISVNVYWTLITINESMGISVGVMYVAL